MERAMFTNLHVAHRPSCIHTRADEPISNSLYFFICVNLYYVRMPHAEAACADLLRLSITPSSDFCASILEAVFLSLSYRALGSNCPSRPCVKKQLTPCSANCPYQNVTF